VGDLQKAAVYLMLLLGASFAAYAQSVPGSPAASVPKISAGQVPVLVPMPSELALHAYQTGNVLWLAAQVWTLAVPILLLFTGTSAKMSGWANRMTPWRPMALAVYLILFLTATIALNLPLSYYAGYLRPDALGLSNQSIGGWFGSVPKSFLFNAQFPPLQIGGLVVGYPLVLLLFWILKRSPKRWWLYSGLALVPFLAFAQFLRPVWLDPLLHHYGPLKDQELETEILQLGRRAGIEGGHVFEVEMSRETKSMGASVVGSAGTKRVILWDTTIAGMERRELMYVVGHEMGHFVLGHGRMLVLFQPCILLVVFGFVYWAASPILKKYKTRLGFEALSDIAALPLILLLANVALLVLLPLDFAFLRYQEHEADRFAVELTRDNHAAATAYVKLTQGVLGVPRHGWLYTLWRDTHPSLGDAVEFFNEYRPWQTGQPLKYGRFIDSADERQNDTSH
jgi:STE24 endopeptidase